MPRKPHIANAIKDMGASKATTRRIADTARPRPTRKAVAQTLTKQGGSRTKGARAPDTPHPSQAGGVKPDARNEERRGNTPRDRRSGEKAPGAGLVKGPARSRLKDPSVVGGRNRTGRDRGGANVRGRARKGSRTRGRG